MVVIDINKRHPEIWEFLIEVPDPEMPAINLVELGVIRNVEKEGDQLTITITPTYTGCPAKKLFEDLIREKLLEKGFQNVEINTVLSPAWNTDWLSEETKAKMMADGISPPTDDNKVVICPLCKSVNTKLISQFGSTPCQSFHSCIDCLEPFNYFKCHR
ncbi:MAG: ring-1,2-phenylacetyl-CoA epoxidase subunit PaaD [Arenicella sp.]|jgi:ring-1,2-phenylacetyl-CoA epoxidase subunit PaaD